jgi:hypothetical protein
MPSSRPCAAFEPISPDFDLKGLVESQANFEWVVRIHCDMIDHQGLENFEKLVLIHVILGGKPLVIEGYEGRLDRWTFALQWLRDNCGSKGMTHCNSARHGLIDLFSRECPRPYQEDQRSPIDRPLLEEYGAFNKSVDPA